MTKKVRYSLVRMGEEGHVYGFEGEAKWMIAAAETQRDGKPGTAVFCAGTLQQALEGLCSMIISVAQTYNTPLVDVVRLVTIALLASGEPRTEFLVNVTERASRGQTQGEAGR